MPTLRDIGEFMLDPLQGLNTVARSTLGDLAFPMERYLQSKNAPRHGGLQRAGLGADPLAPPPPPRQQAMRPPLDPMADTFDARFGDWDVIRALLREQLRGTVPLTPGQYLPDELGYRGMPAPGGLRFLRGF
jgi:hypothetical protein